MGCRKPSGGAANPFVGKWVIHLERTMAESKKSPKYDEKDEAKMAGFFTSMMDSVGLEITGDKMIYARGDRKTAQPYKVKSRDDSAGKMTATSEAGGQKVEIAFTLIDGKYMNFKSSGTDDMDYYVWEREAEGSE